MKNHGSLAQWLQQRCKGLTVTRVAAEAGLSRTIFYDIMRGHQPLPETIRKLAKVFTDGTEQSVALEDHLLALAGYRTERPLRLESNDGLLRVIVLLRPEHQHIVEDLVRELAKIEGIEVPTSKEKHATP